jgi:hypothetical protein
MKRCQHVGCRTSRSTLQEPNQRQGGLLRTRRERPCDCGPASKDYELTPLHSITSSARVAKLVARKQFGTSSAQKHRSDFTESP